MFGELLPDAINSASYLIFPIFCKSHRTLLILDTTRPMWLYYNSLKIQGRDNYFDASTPLRLAITKYICSEIRTSRLENFSSTACMCPTPKQQPNSLDCGPIVCYIIQHYINNDVDGIAQSLTKHHVRKIRADITHKILSQKSRSWTLEMHKSEEEARRLHGKLNCRDNKVKLNEP
ncbi:uncharacterized protein LOC131334710 [Rhododendron vialii]|uniref:uncharacterized protein LOC131334710 n=1 Tax=Rhododendron vialii TaxID=182163 RepID=UPI0026601F76|nr:uncharacterized protein LOC131334710 [Rhododendron vialii]